MPVLSTLLRRLSAPALFLFALSLTGCIWMEKVDITLDPKSGTGHLVYQDLKSSPSHGDQDWTSVDVKKDFKRFYKAYKKGKLSDMPEGVEVTSKALYEKREQLWAEYDIKYQKLEGMLGFQLVDDLYRITKGPEVLSHNGQELTEGETVYVTWSKNTTEPIKLVLDYNFQHPNTRSLVKDYRKKLKKRAVVRE